MSGVPGDVGWLARRNDEAAKLLARELARVQAENEEMRRTFGSHPLFAEQRRTTIEEDYKMGYGIVARLMIGR